MRPTASPRPGRIHRSQIRRWPSRVSGGRAGRVVHHIPMTNRAGIAAQDSAGRSRGGQGSGGDADTVATVPQVPFGEWPSPVTAADVARGRLRISYPTIIGG